MTPLLLGQLGNPLPDEREASKRYEAKLIALRGYTDTLTITVGYFSTSLSTTDGKTRQKISKDVEELNTLSTNRVYVAFLEYSTQTSRIQILPADHILYKIHRILGYETNVSKCKRNEIRMCSLSTVESN